MALLRIGPTLPQLSLSVCVSSALGHAAAVDSFMSPSCIVFALDTGPADKCRGARLVTAFLNTWQRIRPTGPRPTLYPATISDHLGCAPIVLS